MITIIIVTGCTLEQVAMLLRKLNEVPNAAEMARDLNAGSDALDDAIEKAEGPIPGQ